jgi:acetyl esterase/lipase
MKTTMLSVFLMVVVVMILPACSLAGTPPATPSPSPTPFGNYGQALSDVTYCIMDGQPQKMDIYFPQSGGPWPAVVYVHGGSWMKGDKSEAKDLGAALNAQGYLVVSLNYRLYPYAKFPAMIEDVKCAVRSLRAHAVEYNLDPDHVAAWGASAGGHLVTLLGTSDKSAGWDVGEYPDQSSRLQAVIDLSGPSDLTKQFTNGDIQLMMIVNFGQDQLVADSPVTYVTPEDPPFLIFHGDNDGVIPVEQAHILYDKLVAAGVPAQLVIVENGDHQLIAPDGSATPNSDERWQMMLDFLESNLR